MNDDNWSGPPPWEPALRRMVASVGKGTKWPGEQICHIVRGEVVRAFEAGVKWARAHPEKAKKEAK